MKTFVLPLAALGLAFACSHKAFAEMTLYNNGIATYDGAYGFDITSGTVVSDSFTVTGASTVSEVDFVDDSFLYPGVPPAPITQVDWTITNGPPNTHGFYNVTTYGFGTSTVNTLSSTLVNGDDEAYLESFLTGSVDLTPGTTYYLNLTNAVSVSTSTDWAVDTDQLSSVSYATGSSESNSESFDIIGNDDVPPGVPEPSGNVPLGIGVLFLGFLLYRSRRRAPSKAALPT